MGQQSFTPITTRADLIAFAARLDGVREIGFDTEFHAEQTYWPKVMLLQFSTPNEVVLVDPLASEVKAALGGFLELIKMRKQILIGHALEHDLGIFLRLNGGLPVRIFDTQLAAAFLGYERPVSLGALLQDRLQVEVDKLYSRADWGKRPLPPAQAAYAADDVSHLFKLSESLRNDLSERGRLSWVEEECQGLLNPDRYLPSNPDEAWRRVSRKPTPGTRAYAVLVSVAAERERLAQETDKSPRRLLSDEVVVDLARRAPQKPTELEADTRRRPAPNLSKHADRWLEAVQVGLESTIEPVSETVRSPDEQAAYELCRVLAHWSLLREGIAPWLIANLDEKIRQILLTPPNDMNHLKQLLAVDGWKAEILLPPLWRVTGEGHGIKLESVPSGLRGIWPCS